MSLLCSATYIIIKRRIWLHKCEFLPHSCGWNHQRRTCCCREQQCIYNVVENALILKPRPTKSSTSATLKITGWSGFDGLKLDLYICARLPPTLLPWQRLKFLVSPFPCSQSPQLCFNQPHIQGERSVLLKNTFDSKLQAWHEPESLSSLSRYLNGSSSSGPSAIPPAATCRASTTWSRPSLSSTSSSTLVSASCSVFSVTGCRRDSLPFVLMQALLLIEHFYTRHDSRAGGVDDNKSQRTDPGTPWDCVVFRLDSRCPFVATPVSSICRPSFQSDLDPSDSFCV